MREQPFRARIRGWTVEYFSNNYNNWLQSIVHFCLRAPTPRLQFLEREKLSQVYCGKKEDFSRTLVRIESFFKSHLTAVMRGFLFPLSCVDRLLFHSGHVSKVAGRCHKERLGLRVARAFTSKLQEALLATGRK